MHKGIWILVLGLFTFPIQAESHKIQILMTVPRTVSTAFEKSMRARGDHKVFHEPWDTAYLYQKNLLLHAPSQELIDARDYEGVKALFYRYAEKQPVFVKDMIWAIRDDILQDRTLFDDPNVVLTILIRNPALSIESFFLKMAEKVPMEKAVEYTRWVICYDALYSLAENYSIARGEWPMIVEAENLCANPRATMEEFCQRAGIVYKPEALVWERGSPEDWRHLDRWHTDAAESMEFFIPKRHTEERRFPSVPEEYVSALEAIYQEQKPFYEKLKKINAASSCRL